MITKKYFIITGLFSALVLLLLGAAAIYSLLYAHCDTLNGPVVKASKNALESGNINYILIWTQKEDEAELTAAFNKTLAMRKLSKEAQEFADMSFYETAVRLHRSGEGEPYTGLKPASEDPLISALDESIEKSSYTKTEDMIIEAVKEGIRKHFEKVMSAKNYNVNDVNSGREYVKSYVEYIHYAERLYETAKGEAESHNKEKSKHEME